MEQLYGPIRDYAWGSRESIARLQGRPTPSPGPEAELWLGAHPGAPAHVERDGRRASLLDLVSDEPGHWLGAPVVERFGPRLPFLLKVLAAEQPLSLQAHPNAEQASAGHATEQARPAGDTRHRNYVDPYHKPELLVALTPMAALCGFRDPTLSADLLAEFDVPALGPVVTALRGGTAGLAEAVRLLLSWPVAERAGLVKAVCAASVPAEVESTAELVRELAARYPEDPGTLVAVLLNHVVLAPGEAIWMPAGNLHAYLRGTGVEILANSDNVLRGGLTSKTVDVPELLRVLRFEVLDDPVVRAVPVAPGVVTWPAPVADFALYGVTVDEPVRRVELASTGPRVVLCTGGRLNVDDGAGLVTLASGEAAVAPAAAGPLVLSGGGVGFVATTGRL